MTENWKQWKIGLNSTVCKDCDRVMFYGGVLAVFYVSLYCRIRLAILADVFGNTGCEALVMGENRDRYGCKTRENRVKGLGAMGVRS